MNPTDSNKKRYMYTHSCWKDQFGRPILYLSPAECEDREKMLRDNRRMLILSIIFGLAIGLFVILY